MRYRLVFATAAVAALVAAAPAADDAPGLPAGNYILSYSGSPAAQQRLALLKVEAKDGKPAVSVASTGPRDTGYKATDLTVAGQAVGMKFTLGGRTLTFEGVLDPKNPKAVRGSLGDADLVLRAFLDATDKDKLEQADMVVPVKVPDEIAEVRKLMSARGVAMQKAAREKDPAAKAKLAEEAKEAAAAADEKAPAIYKTVLAAHPGTPAAVASAEALITLAGKLKASEADVAGWAAVIETDAASHGPRFAQSTVGRLAASLAGIDGYAPLTLKYAERAAAQPGLAVKARVSALKLLAAAQAKAGQTDAAAGTEREVAKLDGELDAEYLKTVPPFKPETYAGRKDKAANRVAVVELFTGAQCPPCVAADVGFDALIKAYPARDVVLLQYHLHIPGPDPLTNADSEARFGYYGKRFEDDFGGTPTTAFNGKPGPRAGGVSMANAEPAFIAFKKVIDDALEQSTDVKLTGAIKKTGDALAVSVDVAGIKEPKDSVKLRLVLVEENIKYVGGNGLRFHHHVVRGLLGTTEGVPVKDMKDGKYTASASLKEVRDGLTAYLTKSHADRPFPNPDRPLALKDLKVVALIQDDATGEVLQAATLDMSGE